VPIDIDRIDAFDPFKVPSIIDLNSQLDVCDSITTDKKIKDYKKLSMKEYIEVFERFLYKLEKTWKGKNIQQSGKIYCLNYLQLKFNLRNFF
jgi:hypothetical protein